MLGLPKKMISLKNDDSTEKLTKMLGWSFVITKNVNSKC